MGGAAELEERGQPHLSQRVLKQRHLIGLMLHTAADLSRALKQPVDNARGERFVGLGVEQDLVVGENLAGRFHGGFAEVFSVLLHVHKPQEVAARVDDVGQAAGDDRIALVV